MDGSFRINWGQMDETLPNEDHLAAVGHPTAPHTVGKGITDPVPNRVFRMDHRVVGTWRSADEQTHRLTMLDFEDRKSLESEDGMCPERQQPAYKR